jgi:hypothetical protein
MAIAVTAPGSTSLKNLEIKTGSTSSDIEQAAANVLTGQLDIATAVEVRMDGNKMEIEVTGPRMHFENVWYYQCMGSPIASILASIASDGLDKPVRIMEDSYNKGKSIIKLEVLG